MLARKEFLKMREKHEENKIRNKKVAGEVKPMVDENFIAEVREQVYKNLQKISEQKKTEKKHQQTQKKQKQIDTYNKNRVTAKEHFKEIQERPVSRRTRSQTKQNREELKKLERYVY